MRQKGLDHSTKILISPGVYYALQAKVKTPLGSKNKSLIYYFPGFTRYDQLNFARSWNKYLFAASYSVELFFVLFFILVFQMVASFFPWWKITILLRIRVPKWKRIVSWQGVLKVFFSIVPLHCWKEAALGGQSSFFFLVLGQLKNTRFNGHDTQTWLQLHCFQYKQNQNHKIYASQRLLLSCCIAKIKSIT